MNVIVPGKDFSSPINLNSVVESIVNTQRPTGDIPWCEGKKTDPWDLVESAMGLGIGGRISEARMAFDWLKRNQLADGSWYSSYIDGEPDDRTHEANMSSYIAAGQFHHYLLTGDREYLESMWPCVKRAIEFALSLQAPGGEIHWAKSPEGVVDPMALMTGTSSVFFSLKCALSIAEILGERNEKWLKSLALIRESLVKRPHTFNISKSRFSMDWFYPILSGALTGAEAQKRVDKYWKKFVVEGQGVRCVSDEPWVTVAETMEFVLSLSAMGNDKLARIIFGWIQDRRYEDGSYWCGFTFPDMVVWPEDKLSWTNGVVLMAADALYDLTPASRLFSHSYWENAAAIKL
jgi:hypothetical protein